VPAEVARTRELCLLGKGPARGQAGFEPYRTTPRVRRALCVASASEVMGFCRRGPGFCLGAGLVLRGGGVPIARRCGQPRPTAELPLPAMPKSAGQSSPVGRLEPKSRRRVLTSRPLPGMNLRYADALMGRGVRGSPPDTVGPPCFSENRHAPPSMNWGHCLLARSSDDRFASQQHPRDTEAWTRAPVHCSRVWPTTSLGVTV
jgi:hypothetical protein